MKRWAQMSDDLNIADIAEVQIIGFFPSVSLQLCTLNWQFKTMTSMLGEIAGAATRRSNWNLWYSLGLFFVHNHIELVSENGHVYAFSWGKYGKNWMKRSKKGGLRPTFDLLLSKNSHIALRLATGNNQPCCWHPHGGWWIGWLWHLEFSKHIFQTTCRVLLLTPELEICLQTLVVTTNGSMCSW